MARIKNKKNYYQKGIRTIVGYLVPHRRELIVLASLSMVSALGNSVTPYLGGKLFDAMIQERSPVIILGATINPFVFIIGVWLLARLLTDITEWRKQCRQEAFAATLEADYIIHGFARLLRFPLRFHKKQKMGEITQRIQRASSWLDQIVNRVLIDLTPQFFSIVIAIFIAFSIHPLLAALLCAAVAVYALILVRVAPQLSVLSRAMHRAYSGAYGDAHDTVLNIAAVKQVGAEQYERRKLFRNFRLRAARLWSEYIRIGSDLNFSQRLIVTCTQGVLFIASVYLIRAGQISLGGLVAFNGYAAMLFGPFVILGRNWDLIQNGISAIERAEEILRYPEEIYVPKNAVVLATVRGEVQFRDVRFRYDAGQSEVLQGISFVVPVGTSVALVGESGVGKTTLTELISGYYRPSKGSITVDGHNIARLDLAALRSAIAVVPQEVILFNDTVRNNIRYGRFGANDEEVGEAARMAHADEFIDAFPRKYNQKVGERGIKLSTGQKQRIAIARAILRAPKILILDEPTSALDAHSETLIADSLTKLMRGRTTFIIAHRLSTVRKVDMILVLEKGKVIESGTHEELIQKSKGVYRRLYELQIGLR